MPTVDPDMLRAKARRKYVRRKARDPEGVRLRERAKSRRRAQRERREVMALTHREPMTDDDVAALARAMLALKASTNWKPTTCSNCDAPSGPKLYCSELCGQVAKTIRYARRRLRDGRFDDPLVKEAIGVRVAFVVAGGYPERERRLAARTRQAVTRRDGDRCRACNKPGTEVDHIAGNSSLLENLQLLCNRCHMVKTQASMKPVDPEDTKTMGRLKDVRRRIVSDRPERFCDDEREWPNIWLSLRKQARAAHAIVNAV